VPPGRDLGSSSDPISHSQLARYTFFAEYPR
jgi:hypothetical protein